MYYNIIILMMDSVSITLRSSFMQVRARTIVGYGNFSAPKTIELDQPTGGLSESGSSSGGGGTVAVAAVFAILGWIILIAIIVATITAFIWYNRRRKTKT